MLRLQAYIGFFLVSN